MSFEDPRAEAAVLGACLLNTHVLNDVLDCGLRADHFSEERNEAVFRAMRQAAPHIDVVTVAGKIDDEDLLRYGGQSFLTGLSRDCPSITTAPQYAEQVLEAARKRQVRAAMQEACERLEREPSEDVALHVQRRLDVVIGGVGADALPSPSADVETFLADLQTPLNSISSGFRALDRRIGGLIAGDLIVLAARPSMGKTALALNIGDHVAAARGSVLLFSLEMSRIKVLRRRIGNHASIDTNRLRDRGLTEGEQAEVSEAADELRVRQFVIDDRAGVSIEDVRRRANAVRRGPGLDLVIVDYLQLMRGSGRSREQEISGISRGLKALAKELHVPVIALSQLNRACESRADKRPQMSDLRESGAIEQDADVVAFLYRDEQYVQRTENRGLAELIVRKARDGSTGPVRLLWKAPFQRFHE